MNFPWMLFVDLGIIGGALALGTLIRARVRFFQRFLIPNALTAGFILLVFYNSVAPLLGMSQEGLGALAYHLLNLSFISMTLRTPSPEKSKSRRRAFSLSIGLLSQFGIQATLGFVMTFVFIFTIMPDLFPAFGLLVPLGFAQGPGQAFAIGESWVEDGFVGAGTVGLTFAAIGFMWACFGGVYLVNRGIRRGWINRESLRAPDRQVRSGIYSAGERPIGMRLTTESVAIDSFSYHAAVVLGTYLLTYLTLQLISYLLAFAGPLGDDLATSLWGIAFIFGALVAMVVRIVLAKTGTQHVLGDGGLTRLAGFSVDFMVAGALGAISLVVVTQYWLPILVMSLLAGLQALILIPWMGSRMYPDHQLGRTMIVYGASTGTLATGLALLRVLDPDFETPVATDYMSASAITFVFAIPLIVFLKLPIYGKRTGDPRYYWFFLGICLSYILFTSIAYVVMARKRALASPGKLWLAESEEDTLKVV